MKRKTIDAGREIRLWIGQVIIPTATVAAVFLSNPDTRAKIQYRVNGAKDWVKGKFTK